MLDLHNNPLNPELAEVYNQGIDGVKAYLRARAEGEVTLDEAKLILVGEGGVGKTSLLAALHGDAWVENRKTTYGMEVDVTSLVLKDPVMGTEITFKWVGFWRARYLSSYPSTLLYCPSHLSRSLGASSRTSTKSCIRMDQDDQTSCIR
jgi:hypothetical protein